MAVSDVPVLTARVRNMPLLTMTLVTVTPPPETVTVVPPTTKWVPASVTATLVPRTP